jgi:uncharacterized membrane protein
VALLGVLYYLTVFFLAIAYLDKKHKKILSLLSLFTIVGLMASAWFVYAQLVLLDAICLYCMGSAVTSTTLFGFGMWTFFVLRERGPSVDLPAKE